MAGMDEATIGTVTWSRGLVVAFAPQDPQEHLLRLSLYAAVRDAIAPEIAEIESWRVDILLDDLAVDAEIRDRVVDNLSGGWQTTTLLARAAVVEPTSSCWTNRRTIWISVGSAYWSGFSPPCHATAPWSRRATTVPFSTT